MIKKLDNSLINQIAAGEVVERPVSVVKELTENAVDSGATQITIEIKDGGISYIRVTDNGKGIEREELETAFQRHATSKIESLEDLESIMTLGFRGEALSSIASVALVEMITKTNEALTGASIELRGGEAIDKQEAGCPEGTTVVVRSLFFNTPARFKFLKKPATEGGYISDMVGKLALGHPEIGFTYINNGSILLQTNGKGDLKTAIFQVYGKDIAKKLIPVDYEKDGFHIEGFIGRPEIARGNRLHESFFLNGRFIKSEILRQAVEDAYKTKLMGGKFPFFVLHLLAAPDTVDVNVHPTKLEVRFSKELEVFNAVREAVDSALRDENLIPEARLVEKNYSQVANTTVYEAHKQQERLPDVTYTSRIVKPLQVAEALPASAWEKQPEAKRLSIKEKLRTALDNPMADEGQKSREIPEMPEMPENQELVDDKLEDTPPFFQHYRIAGHIFHTYWLVDQESSLYLIDQHAAHERIYYEELSELYQKKRIPSQRLLQPMALSLSHSERLILQENRELLEGFGFELEEFGEASYVLRSVPFIFNGPASPEFIIEIIDRLSSLDANLENIYQLRANTIAGISCKAAVKANDRLTEREAEALIEKLLKLKDPFTCPHGRPTIIEMTKSEIEKKFGRI